MQAGDTLIRMDLSKEGELEILSIHGDAYRVPLRDLLYEQMGHSLDYHKTRKAILHDLVNLVGGLKCP